MVKTSVVAVIVATVLIAGLVVGYFTGAQLNPRTITSTSVVTTTQRETEIMTETKTVTEVTTVTSTETQYRAVTKTLMFTRTYPVTTTITSTVHIVPSWSMYVVFKDKPVNIPAGKGIYFDIPIKFPGYLHVSYTATTEVEIIVQGSYKGYTYETTYKGAIGDFIAPVLPGTARLIVSNPSWQGASVALTVYYNYFGY